MRVCPNTKSSHHNSPVYSSLLRSMFLQHKSLYKALNNTWDLGVFNTPQSGIHVQCFFSRHLINKGIKLGTVAEILLNLDEKKKDSHKKRKGYIGRTSEAPALMAALQRLFGTRS